MNPYIMMLVAQTAGKAISNAPRIFQRKFGNTAYGKQLQYAKKEGNLSPGAEKGILNKVGEVAGRQADTTTNKYMGSFINRGIQDSVAVKRGLREAQQDVRSTVADTAKGMYIDEEKAKRDAKMRYAQGTDAVKADRWKAIGEVGGAVADATATAYGQKYQDQLNLDAENKLKDQARDKRYQSATDTYGAGHVRPYSLPSGQIGYTGSYDPSSPGGTIMPIATKQAIETYAQKANIKNSSTVANTFEAFQNKDIDAKSFITEMKKLGINEEQIVELIAIISRGK